jgi:hypothetical protein
MKKKLIKQQIVHKGWLFEIQIRMKSFKRMFDRNVLGVVTEG